MSEHNERKNRSLTVCAGVVVALVVMAGLPLLSMLAVATRAIAFAALLALVVGAIAAYPACPSLRRWVRSRVSSETAHKGLRVSSEVALDPHHVWVKERRGIAVVGADDLLCTALGPVDNVEFPKSGSRVQRGEGLLRLYHGNRSIELPAPVSGVVFHHNESLREHPDLVNHDPYGRGWMVTLSSDDLSRDRGRLRRGRPAIEWFRAEIDRLIAVLSGDAPEFAVAMADGGALVEELHRHIDDAEWQHLKSAFFGETDSSTEAE